MADQVDVLDADSVYANLATSSTKRRTTELHILHDKFLTNDVQPQVSSTLLQLLLPTYALYCDRSSRRATQECISAVLASSSGPSALKVLCAFLRRESLKKNIAPASRYVLLEWCALSLKNTSSRPQEWRDYGKDLIKTLSECFEKYLACKPRENRVHAAFVTTRRAIRSLLKNSAVQASALKDTIDYLTAKTSSATAEQAPLLGVVCGVASRLSDVQQEVKTRVPDVHAFYVREILGSKIPLPVHIANGLHDFFINFEDQESFGQDIVPALEKSLLRSPEIVLNDLITPLTRSLPSGIDISKALEKNLLKPLISATKSTNVNVREGALSAYKAIVRRCRDDDANAAVADELLRNLKDAKGTDQRIIIASLLASSLPTSASVPKVTLGLTPVVAKEGNEAALYEEAFALGRHVEEKLRKDEAVDATVIKAFTDGARHKKPSIRRIWALAAGEVLWELFNEGQNAAIFDFASSVFEALLPSFEETLANPVPSALNGLAVVAYVTYCFALQQRLFTQTDKAVKALRKPEMLDQLQNADSKSSTILNPRVYSKLSTEVDVLWVMRALEISSQFLEGVSEAARLAWAHAFTYLIVASSVPPTSRQQAYKSLSQCSAHRPSIVPAAIVNGLWRWIPQVYAGERDTAAVSAQSGTSQLWLLLRAICSARNFESAVGPSKLSPQLVHLLVLCRRPLITRVQWIDLCLKAAVDPQTLVSENLKACIERIKEHCSERNDHWSKDVHEASCQAASELAFVSRDKFTPELIELIKSDLDASLFQSLGPEEAAIYRTPEGVAFVDVLAKTNERYVPNKNVKDYDLLKWEEDLRAQIAGKQGQKKKLSADDEAKVKAQLRKESSIRSEVRRTAVKLFRGAGIIRCLAHGPPTDIEAWSAPAIASLLGAIDNGAMLLGGDLVANSYLSLSTLVASRLGALRSSIGVATLRARGVSQLPEELLQEPLGELVTRVLYRLRFSAEQRPLDMVSLLYVLPLVEVVLSSGGVGRNEPDEVDEQVMLTLDFLSFHLDLFADVRLPRRLMSSVLITALQRYPQHYRLIRDCLSGICHALAPEAAAEEVDVYLQGCIAPQSTVRQALLQIIDSDLDLQEDSCSIEVWLACHDDMEENAEIARIIWEENSQLISGESAKHMIPYLDSDDRHLRSAAAKALAACVENDRFVFGPVIHDLEDRYVEKARPRVPEKDAYGLSRKTDLRDPWEARHGIALAFRHLAAQFEDHELENFIQFLIERGPFADKHDTVRDEMVKAASHVVTAQGSSKVEELLSVLETTLDSPASSSAEQDKINEAVIILYGAVAGHLKAGDARVPNIVSRLLATLATPSETVQDAVAKCLPALVRASLDKVSEYLTRILEDLQHSKKYATRRGAAYGLAGVVSGKGISSLREARIMSTLKAASEEKKDSNQRQGAFLAYELLSSTLGQVFEPYVIQIVPQLLTGFGDPSADVRDACLDASKMCFSTLSSYGVKKILPTLLEGLDEVQWRSKKGACESLGAMAYLDPEQLAVSLPEIIPPLTTVLNDSHKEVRSSANRSLQRFGDVISNPEIKSLVPILLRALSDATKYTDEALDALLKVSFSHYLDAPSLALVVRILERGLSDRSQTKRKSAQIIGSLAHLTDRKDIVTHLPILVSGLRVAAVDPVQTTRATASKALGTLVEKLGEDALPDLIPSLMATLKTDTGAGDRLGSAQALSEVLAGLGVGRLEETLPSILQNISSTKSAVREGFMSMFIFLPACFGNSFANYLSKIIPPILSGLADEVESIRETSLRAGRLLVKNFATKAIDLLLPELQRGLGDLNYRIRLSSIELVGDLLFNLTGISARMEGDEEPDENAAGAQQSLLEVLGEERRANVLSALYISRCDTSGLVRTSAIQVWKALVATPRTLREITPTLTQVIIRRLGSPNPEQKHIAGNALGELIRKAGEGVLSTLLPTLEQGLETSVDSDAKQGICIALRELISSASQEALEEHEPKLIAVVRTAIVDRDASVREAAAEAFDSLQRLFGKKVIDQILPYLLGLLRDDEEAENALAALLTLLTEQTRSNIILPNLLPTLLSNPISAFNARALASLASVAGTSMIRRLPSILNALLDNIVSCKDEERLEALDAAFDAVTLSMDEFDGLNALMSVMLGLSKHDDHQRRRATGIHFATFFSKAEVDYSRYHADLIRILLIAFDDNDAEVVKAAWTALSTLTSKLAKEDMDSLVTPTRQVLSQVGVAGHNLPGFQLPKGINAVLPIFLHGLVNGSPNQKVEAALAISELIDKTSSDALKPFVTNITGPLIRVISERSTEVKAAILVTLNNLLEKIPTFLKPFLPQLQRTFTKSLADPTSDVLRMRAARALGTLITMTPRIDPLIGELVTGSKTSDPGVKNAMQKALFEVISRVGANMSGASRNAIIDLIDNDTDENDDTARITNAKLLGALIKNLNPEVTHNIVKTRVLSSQRSTSSVLALNAILLDAPETLTTNYNQDTITTICKGIASPEPAIAENSVMAAGKYLLSESTNHNFEISKTLFEALAPVMQPGSPIDTRRFALTVTRTVARRDNDLIRPHLPLLVPPIFASVRDPIIPIKLAAEAAFIGIFDVVDEDSAVFDKYMAGPGAEMPPGPKRAMGDYFKRVAVRLAAQARERREAEGGAGGLGLSNDEREDEREIWSVGKVELEGVFEG
ncbi:MAG: hypothetical protein Q9159_006144 [Coniocarpon cinnabarinum]